jgi:4-hydroxy-tetrahydrodipicolinate synthase
MKPFNSLPEGLWPVMLTPLQENNALDLSGLQELTDMYLNAGANGLFANCLSGEMYQLTEEERLLVTRTVVNQSNGRVAVVATGTFSNDVHYNVEFIKKLYDTGLSAIILITGVLARMDEPEEVLKNRIEEIMEKTEGIPLGLYECPFPYKRLVCPQLMKWLADSGRFIYHKDTSCHTFSIEKKVQATQGSIFCLYTYLLRHFRTSGRTPELNQFYSLLVVMDKLVHTFYPYSAKLFLQKRGLKINSNSRIPTEYMSQADVLRFDALFDIFQSLASMHDIELVISRQHMVHGTH